MEAITFSHGIRRLPGLAGLLGVDAIRWHLSASTAPAAPRDLVLGWGSKRNALRTRCFATDHGLTYLSLEDGFLRSVKLGTSGATPYSLVVDDVGIYYDARYPSRLENLLNGEVLANLLEAVRRTYPEAYILYKPHPDVVSGNRAAGRMRPSMADYDQLIEDATLAACLDAADEVHTMTSLVGFEALLRGKRVVTYGLPFYAGWGLTEDRHALPRRNRRLDLDELVAGVLLHYPRYVSDISGEFTSAEWTVERLATMATVRRSPKSSMLGRFVRIARAFTCGVLRELRSNWKG